VGQGATKEYTQRAAGELVFSQPKQDVVYFTPIRSATFFKVACGKSRING